MKNASVQRVSAGISAFVLRNAAKNAVLRTVKAMKNAFVSRVNARTDVNALTNAAHLRKNVAHQARKKAKRVAVEQENANAKVANAQRVENVPVRLDAASESDFNFLIFGIMRSFLRYFLI